MTKRIYILLSLVFSLTYSCYAQKAKTESELKPNESKKTKLAIDTVAEIEKKSAYDFAYQTFTNCDTYEFPELTTENATERLVKLWKTDKSKVIEICDSYNSAYGKLLEIKISEILTNKTGNKFFRYKATFSKTENIAEIRVYTNSENKFDGIIIFAKWTDKYSEYKEKTKSE